MSACDRCLARSLARAGVVDSLEAGRMLPVDARRELDSAAPTILQGVELESERCRELAEAAEVWMICRHSDEFPTGCLRFERESDVPWVLYGVGERLHLAAMLGAPGVSLVGARRATAYGREVAYNLGRESAEAGLTVVSGLALGVDGAAHRGALQGGGPTIAVLAGGAERPYPRSHRLLHEQVAENGCVISETPPRFEARRWSFVARNRIIAALSALTVFIEGTKSSGARHTVDFAEQLDLLVGAVPGPITSPMSAGPNALLAELGVVAVRGVDDLLAAVGVERFRLPSDAGPTGSQLEDPLLEAILAGARDPRSLEGALPELGTREISQRLGELELAGRLRRLAGGEYEVIGRLR